MNSNVPFVSLRVRQPVKELNIKVLTVVKQFGGISGSGVPCRTFKVISVIYIIEEANVISVCSAKATVSIGSGMLTI